MMAKTIKFNLVCDGSSVRTLEDLRNNFLIEDVLEYYKNGLLLRWLKVRGFGEEYEKINAIREYDDISIIKKLIDIFGMEIEESEIEESIYILQYEYKRKASLDRYRNSSNNLESMIDKHIQEYNRFVNFIIKNNDDMPKIKAALKQIEQNYIHIFKLDYRNLFFKFRFEAPMAIFAMITIDKMRECYLFNENEEERLSEYIKTLEDCDAIEYWQKYFDDKKEIVGLIASKVYMSPLEKILGDNLKVFKGATSGYWKDVEPKGKKFMILKIEPGNFVRASGESGQELSREDVLNKFEIVDGIDYKSNSDTNKLLYMEV